MKNQLCLFTLLAAILPGAAWAESVSVTDFRVIEDGLFFPIVDRPISNAPRVWDLGRVSIASPRASIVGGIFPFEAGLTGSDPTGTSWLGYTGDSVPAVFNLSQPVAALGVTFNFISTRNDAILRVYDGPDATGNLVGSVVSPQVLPPWNASNRSVDFVAAWAGDATIRSFTIDGPAPGQGASITGYAVSFTPVPEPAAGVLFALMMIGMAGSRSQRCLP